MISFTIGLDIDIDIDMGIDIDWIQVLIRYFS